ncbi:unnamed protein product [Euphydryas editha]|uniref:Uncharacterized protein n=1 Tax=Euphydryas editha TaxID=104508 RepID=A0AAU9UYH7_EUPED|nr:unnamed protein product [Euphydryas editha]
MLAENAGGCINKGFDSVDDGFQTIDLRVRREDGDRTDRDGEWSSERDLRCGWGVLRPAWLQRFRTAKWALFWLCWAGAIQGK